ncbi:MAG TPA: carboxypeptidase-like regulatory domain-containing protein [Terriglobales bacterium]|nr:carboxypeptidase-like regulatory domain-containing protein [Terriglobales bacterium]
MKYTRVLFMFRGSVFAGILLVFFSVLTSGQSTDIGEQVVKGPSEGPALSGPDRARVQTSTTKAQNEPSFGHISGTILDPTGAVTVGATVQVTSTQTSLSEQTVSGNNGQFSFSRVPSGPFQLTITAPGFANQTFSGELQSGQTFLVPAIVLPVATAQTEVRVGVPTVEVAEAQIKEQEKQRVLSFIPNFYVTYDHDAAPLNARQKFELAWKTAIDPVTLAGVGFYAGLEQAGDRYPEYGQGLQGYAKRYGSGYADTVSGIFVGNAILPSLLKQDPRYFYKGTGTTKSRLLYAVASSVICKGDNKRWQPNYSFILGSIAVGGISNLYVPAAERDGAGLIFQNALIRIGQGSLGGILQEFVLPRLTPRLRHHNNPDTSEP